MTRPATGSLVVKGGRGTIVLQVKGAVIGRMNNGKLTLTDNDPYDENSPVVHGRLRTRPMQLSDATTVYKGQNIRYRMVEGSYRLKFEGSGIRLSTVGRGWVTLDGSNRSQRQRPTRSTLHPPTDPLNKTIRSSCRSCAREVRARAA